MDNNNEFTPVTSGFQTSTVPVGDGWEPMGGYYNMYQWQQMIAGMAAGGSGMPGGQMMPGWGPG